MFFLLLTISLFGKLTLGLPISNLLNTTFSSVTVKGCGESIYIYDSPDRIVGGVYAERGEFPWMVSLREKDSFGFEHVCGATILNRNWILSAAHCFESDKASMYDVIVGLHRLSVESGEHARLHKLTKIILHKQYDSVKYENDIALLKVKVPIDIDGSDGYVNGVCLPKPDQKYPVGYATVTGWGHTRSEGRNSDTLRKVVVPMVSREKCNDAYDEDPDDEIDEIVESMICAGSKGKDSCQADSGGPLIQWDKKSTATLIGVVSSGGGCGLRKFPGVYTRVSYFIDWIESHAN